MKLFLSSIMLCLSISITLVACGSGEKETTDSQKAQALWSEIKSTSSDYTKWDLFPYKSLTPDAKGFVPSASPHGAFARIYVNKKGSITGDGSVIVKENFAEKDENKVVAITVMKKIAGYNPGDADWFWAKYNPDGTLAKNAAGAELAGKIGKGGSSGCIPCHGKTSDYIKTAH